MIGLSLPHAAQARIRALVHAYIRHPTCLVLAVSAANVDLAASDALELARSVDPHGARTLGEWRPQGRALEPNSVREIWVGCQALVRCVSPISRAQSFAQSSWSAQPCPYQPCRLLDRLSGRPQAC